MDAMAPEFAAHFEHLAAGRLCFPHCGRCQRFHWYPMPLCPHCRAGDWQWREVSATGSLFSWTEIHHAFDARYSGPLPYIVALIEFAEAPGIRLVGNLVDSPATSLALGQAVGADFAAVAAGSGPLVFRAI